MLFQDVGGVSWSRLGWWLKGDGGALTSHRWMSSRHGRRVAALPDCQCSCQWRRDKAEVITCLPELWPARVGRDVRSELHGWSSEVSGMCDVALLGLCNAVIFTVILKSHLVLCKSGCWDGLLCCGSERAHALNQTWTDRNRLPGLCWKLSELAAKEATDILV